ncbi:MAG: hypothetical protein Q8Q60_04750 [Candidatus Chromulinivorax sp.]|nr:hypothetical protein [Candidatus Chromulinivorax sp.]
MKIFKSFVFTTILVSSQIYTVDIQKNLEWCGGHMQEYGKNLMTDTTTQLTSVASVVAAVGCYQYYHHNAALVCLDGHPNSRIMYQSNLMYMTYSDFINTIASANSYAGVVEFINTHCTSCCSISDAKINSFIALVNDLQKNNCKRINDDIAIENMILEDFKSNLILAKENIKQELINGAINANKNANNAITVRLVIDIINALFGRSR